MQDVDHRLGQRSSQPSDLGGEALEPGPGGVGERQLLAGVGQGVGEGDHVRRVAPGQRLVKAPRFALAGQPDQLAGAPAEQGEVPRADPPPRAGQHPDERRVGGRVVEHVQHGDEIGDLRQVQQPGQADHLHRHAPAVKLRVDVRDLIPGAHQDRDLRPVPVYVLVEALDSFAQPLDLVGMGGQERRLDPASRVFLGARPEQPHARVQFAQPGRTVVGELEQSAAAAAVLRERVLAGVRTVVACEMPREPVDVRGRGAAPAVDGLARVAHRRHRVAAAEQSGQHPALGHRRVLIFVEQDDLVLVALDHADLGHLLGQPGAQGHLVAEVDEVPGPLELPVVLDEGQQFGPLQRHPGDRPVAGEAARGTGALPHSVGECLAGEGIGPASQSVRVDDVLGELGVEVDDLLGEGGNRAPQVFEGP